MQAVSFIKQKPTTSLPMPKFFTFPFFRCGLHFQALQCLPVDISFILPYRKFSKINFCSNAASNKKTCIVLHVVFFTIEKSDLARLHSTVKINMVKND